MGHKELASFLSDLTAQIGEGQLSIEEWDSAPYKPVPDIVDAATSVFRGHDVREIARADASNLNEASARVVELVREARSENRRRLIFLTGVPGSGKTLAGLQAVHDAVANGVDAAGDIVYLSGNTSLVVVLREALAQDEKRRSNQNLKDIRRDIRARIQHINDFLKEYVLGDDSPPYEHAIVFDEAQRAWDTSQGERKFGREDSEPAILLDLMARHEDWCALIGLVGGGQEINSGENGVAGWGQALRGLPESGRGWQVYGPSAVFEGGESTGRLELGDIPSGIEKHVDNRLRLRVPMRSYRSPRLAEWVDLVLRGSAQGAADLASELGAYPIVLTRSLQALKTWLRHRTRGHRRCGLVATSGARRLRAYGLGQRLTATDSRKIAYWYLKGRQDVRSSYALEVPANEYTCQGLELDFVGLCWGGDLKWDRYQDQWAFEQFRGNQWQAVRGEGRRRYIMNKYRVLMTRGREGLAIWVPAGSQKDHTRNPARYDGTAHYLVSCGACAID